MHLPTFIFVTKSVVENSSYKTSFTTMLEVAHIKNISKNKKNCYNTSVAQNCTTLNLCIPLHPNMDNYFYTNVLTAQWYTVLSQMLCTYKNNNKMLRPGNLCLIKII